MVNNDELAPHEAAQTEEVAQQIAELAAEQKPEENQEQKKDPKQTLEEFDWEAYAQNEVYTKDRKSELEAMYDETLSSIGEGEVVDGTVIAMNKREVVINIGYKSEGVVSLNEFRYNPELKVGDTVEVYVENQEDKRGQLVLSHKKARSLTLLGSCKSGS
jgi:small subunit ribosomal protein S1